MSRDFTLSLIKKLMMCLVFNIQLKFKEKHEHKEKIINIEQSKKWYHINSSPYDNVLELVKITRLHNGSRVGLS